MEASALALLQTSGRRRWCPGANVRAGVRDQSDGLVAFSGAGPPLAGFCGAAGRRCRYPYGLRELVDLLPHLSAVFGVRLMHVSHLMAELLVVVLELSLSTLQGHRKPSGARLHHLRGLAMEIALETGLEGCQDVLQIAPNRPLAWRDPQQHVLWRICTTRRRLVRARRRRRWPIRVAIGRPSIHLYDRHVANMPRPTRVTSDRSLWADRARCEHTSGNARTHQGWRGQPRNTASGRGSATPS